MAYAQKLISTRRGSLYVALIAALLAFAAITLYLKQYRDSVNSGSTPVTVLVAKQAISKGMALAGVAVALALRSVAFAGIRKRETLAQINAYGFEGRALVAAPSRSLKDRLDVLAAALGTPFVGSMRTTLLTLASP